MSKKIYINPGHSDTDPGAVGYETERKLNVKVSNYMNEYLLANYDCQTKVTDSKINSVSQVAADANNWGADLVVSNHFNAGGGDGYEALVYSEKRVPLGKVFEKHVKAIGQNSRGVKLRPDLGVLRLTNMPAVLNEGAFVDNQKDIQDWNEDTELEKMGIAYAKAAAEYLELPAKAIAESGYTLKQFVRDVQSATGAAVDGVVGKETIGKTVTLSSKKNASHEAVQAVQKRLAQLGYSEVGTADGVAGPKFTSAVAHFQQDNGCVIDGEITAKNKTWRKLLGME
jgi:N-acetylmuramoyl-L-alanine amidase